MNIIKLNAIASTNSHLKDLARSSHLEDGTVVVTSQQTSGRGQRGTEWQSQKGKSLTFSVFKRLKEFSFERQFELSMAVSLALSKVLDELQVPKVSIKWPNDIMSAQKKCAGILIENTLGSSGIEHSVIGIGLNVNEEHMNGLSEASSLFLQSGKVFNLDELLINCCHAIVHNLRLLEEDGFEDLHSQYEAQLFRKDVISVFEDLRKEKTNGIIRGVTRSGLLSVEHDGDVYRTYDLKEVKLCYGL